MQTALGPRWAGKTLEIAWKVRAVEVLGKQKAVG
jgi:hypothetical protein